MSKKSKSNNYTPAARVSSSLPLTKLLQAPTLKTFEDLPNADRRRWNPTKAISGPAALNKRAATPKVAPSRRARLPHKIAFAIPKAVKLCVARKTRKSVLHALHIRKGRGSALGKRKKHFNPWSKVKC